jgi:hypothetical protein
MKTVDCHLPDEELTPHTHRMPTLDPELEQAEANLAALIPEWARNYFSVMEVADGTFVAICDAKQILRLSGKGRKAIAFVEANLAEHRWQVYYSSI